MGIGEIGLGIQLLDTSELSATLCQHPGQTVWDSEREPNFRSRSLRNSKEGDSG